MALTITYHGDRPQEGNGRLVHALGPQVGDDFAVADDDLGAGNGEVARLLANSLIGSINDGA